MRTDPQESSYTFIAGNTDLQGLLVKQHIPCLKPWCAKAFRHTEVYVGLNSAILYYFAQQYWQFDSVRLLAHSSALLSALECAAYVLRTHFPLLCIFEMQSYIRRLFKDSKNNDTKQITFENPRPSRYVWNLEQGILETAWFVRISGQLIIAFRWYEWILQQRVSGMDSSVWKITVVASVLEKSAWNLGHINAQRA
jgi:hypothetical protein